MREEKKYEILPGVEIPDIKKIQEAASDFSISEVGEVEIKTVNFQPVMRAGVPAGVSSDELNQLQQLGNKVAEDETKAKAESRAKMDKIMNKAVQAPESIRDLKASHIAQLNEEKRKALEEEMKAAEEQQAEEDAKNKAREERRKLQQRLLEESREKAAKEKAEKEQAEKEQAEKEASERELAEKTGAEKAEVESVQADGAQVENAQSENEEAEIQQTADVPVEQTKQVDEVVAPEEPVTSETVAVEVPASENEVKAEQVVAPAEKTEVPVEPAVKKTAKIASREEAFEDFKEFLDDDNN